MATLATDFKKSDALVYRDAHTAKAASDPYVLRALPNEDVFFFSKRIDNSRLVREADPRARGACWSAIGAACLLVALLTSVLAPSVANTMAGYKLQALKQEQQRLIDERRVLEVEEAQLLSPARLEALARGQQLVSPQPGQVVRLDSKGDRSLASLRVKSR